jgi:rhodanese-related sulfurtransferase
MLLKEVIKMKSLHLIEHGLLSLLAVVALTPAFADALLQPEPISAEEAFDAVQRQVFPGTDSEATVILVDVRDPQEVLSSGAAAAVKEIVIGGNTIEPKLGAVRLTKNGESIEYRDAHGNLVSVALREITSLDIEAIAYNIKLWDQTESGFDLKPQALKKIARAFAKDLVALIDETQADVVIVYCRTGGRSSFAGQFILNGMYTFREDTFWSNRLPYPIEVYEIDDPDGTNGRGGFSGPDYSGVFNGYAGFPGRSTVTQAVPSVSWKDSGLPVKRETKALPD